MTVLGQLGILVLVLCLLLGSSGGLVKSETNATLNETRHKNIGALCQSILEDPKNVTLQALSPLGDQLYLIASDILYTVPFTSEIIDSVGGRFILRDTQSGTHWTQVPWLKQFAGALKVPHPVLVQMTIWPEQVDNADLSGIYKQQINLLYRDKDSISFSQNWKHPPPERESLPIKPYGLIHNGSKTFGPVYEFREMDSAPGIMMIADQNVAVFPCWASDNKTLVFLSKLPEPDSGLRPLVTHLPVFGFIHSKVVHLWDIKNGQVILFDYVPDMADSTTNETYKLQYKSASVRVISFDEYLVCQGRMKISSNTLIILLGLLFLGLPLVLACIGLCCAMMCCSAPKVWSKSRKPAYPPLKVRSYNPKSFKSQSSTGGSTSTSTNSTTTSSTSTTKGTRSAK